MSRYQDFRREFYRELATKGLDTPELAASTRLSGHVPDHIREIWLNRFWRPVRDEQLKSGRHVNHFKLGADPEFTVYRGGSRIDANSLRFKAALAWGADNNGRLCELRPVPHRSALVVTASIASTLRWMHWCNPALADCSLAAGAWNGQDGMGGHVHFGRKRPTIPREISALDTLTYFLYETGVFNRQQGRERYSRSRHYGSPGDVRRQFHGWEYRTQPSWLDSPWQTFLTLTLSKLAVYEPDLFPPLNAGHEVFTGELLARMLKGILAYHQHNDEDAALAYKIASRRGLPTASNGSDFKPRWGLFNPPPNLPTITVIPSSIMPKLDEIEEMRAALLAYRAPDPVVSSPSWTPYNLPKGYDYLPTLTETYHAPGIGEVVSGLAYSINARVLCHVAQQAGYGFKLSSRLASALPEDSIHRLRKILGPTCNVRAGSDDSSAWQITFSSGTPWREETPRLRQALTCGLFPIWPVEAVKESSLQEWQAANSKARTKLRPRQRGRISDSING